LLPKAAYTVGTATPAASAMASMLLPAYDERAD
jgi:hypothetical protein